MRASRLLRSVPWRTVARISLMLSTVLFVVRIVVLADGDWGRMAVSFGHHVWLLGLLLGISLLARSRTLLHVVGAFYGGFFTAMFLATLVGDQSAALLGASDGWHLIVVVPIIEEVSKALPLVLVALSWRRRPAGTVGITDLGILGAAVGAGFAIHEDALWSRVSGSGFTDWIGWIAPSFHTEAGMVVGHAGWTALVGLGIGLWLANPRRRWVILAPVAALAVAAIDHGLWNGVAVEEAYRPFLLDGWLVVWLVLGGFLLTTLLETRLVHQRLEGRALQHLRRWPGVVLQARGPVTAVRVARRWSAVVRAGIMTVHRDASLSRGPST